MLKREIKSVPFHNTYEKTNINIMTLQPFSQEEQDLLQSVYSQEIQSISLSTDASTTSISFTILHSCFQHPLIMTFKFESLSCDDKTNVTQFLPPKCCEVNAEHSLDPRVFANFEVFAKQEWARLVNSTFPSRIEQEKISDKSSLFTICAESNENTNFSELFLAYFPTMFYEFGDDANGKSISRSFANDDNDDDTQNNNSDDDDEIIDWQEFFKKQHEMKVERNNIANNQTGSAVTTSTRGPFRTTDEKYFVLIHEYHHIYSSEKQKFMVEKAIDYDLQGIMLRGKPGRCIIEGKFEDVTTWSRLVKSLRWQRCTEVGIFESLNEMDGKAPWIFDSGFGYRKVESESELKQMLSEETTTPLAVKFFAYAFPSIIIPNRTIS